MSKLLPKQIEVHAHWVGITQPLFMGTLHATLVRGKEIFSFDYDNEWLKSDLGRQIDPSLAFFSGRQYAPQTQENFGGILHRIGGGEF